MKKILIIDDDISINNLLNDILSKYGFSVLRAWSGTEGLLVFEKYSPDLVILDLMLPGMTGEELLPRIKNVPVIVLSAKADIGGKINLLSEGAVDYITKPFDSGELIARINVQLRLNRVQPSVLQYDDITVDVVSHSVTVNGNEIQLTKTEFALLKLFVGNPEKALAKSVILDEISLDTPDCTEYSLKQHIFNLRKKIADANGKDHIESVWGIGFIFR